MAKDPARGEWRQRGGGGPGLVKYKLAIFDFDGTLADTFPWVVGIMDQVADRFQLKRLEPDELETLRGPDARKLLKAYRLPFWKILEIATHVRGLMTQDIHNITLFEGMDRLLKDLSDRGVRLAMVSSNSCENVKHVLGPEIGALFQHYECGVSLFGKAGKFRKILRQSRVMAYEAISIGDEIRDLEAAKSTNIDFGAVSWGYTRVEALMALSPCEVFTSVEDILEKVV
jgi:phosphoglycolate phosphatase